MSPGAPGIKGWGGLAVLAASWGSAFVFIALAVDTIAPSLVVLSRLIVGSAILSAWMYASGKRFPKLTDRRWVWFAGLGFFGNSLPFILVAVGQQTVSSGVTGILMGMTPLIIILAAHFTLPDDKLTVFKSLGFLVGFAGIVMLTGPSALAGLLSTSFLAQMLILAATACYATNTILYQRAPRSDPLVVAAGSLVAAAIFSTPPALFTLASDAIMLPSWQSIVGVLALSIIPTALAQIVYMGIARHVGASFIAIVNYAVPVVAALIGVAIGETLGVMAWLALATILLGIFIARYKT